MWLTLLKSIWPNKKGDISVKTIVIIIITLAVLVLLLYIAAKRGKGLFEVWEKSPLG